MITVVLVPEGITLLGAEDAAEFAAQLTPAHLGVLAREAASHGWAAGGRAAGLNPQESDAIALAAVASVLNLLAKWHGQRTVKLPEETEKS